MFQWKSFGLKKCFANSNNDARINEMLYSVKLESSELMVKKGLDFTFSTVKKFNKILKWNLSVC